MEPIGASSTWRWYGYENSWVDIDGQKCSRSGRRPLGRRHVHQRVRHGALRLSVPPQRQVERTSRSSPRSGSRWRARRGRRTPNYGFANWFLNTGRKPLPNAPETAVHFVGNGANIIYVDWDNDIVAVVRWIGNARALNEFIGRMLNVDQRMRCSALESEHLKCHDCQEPSHTGFASLPLHGGKAPRGCSGAWSGCRARSSSTSPASSAAREVLRRLSDPFWFQAFGCVLGFDWHSSGVTTTVCGAVKEGHQGHRSRARILRRRRQRRRLAQDAAADRRRSASGSAAMPQPLVYASRTAAKVDSAAVQDGYQLYHHVFFFTAAGDWCVVQQGMSDANRHGAALSLALGHRRELRGRAARSGLLRCARRDAEPRRARKRSDAAGVGGSARQPPDATLRADRRRLPMLTMPARHELLPELDVAPPYLEKILVKTYERAPEDFESLLGIEGVGPKTLRALALASELLHGTPASCAIRRGSPSRTAGRTAPVSGRPDDVRQDDRDPDKAINRSAIDRSEKVAAFRRLARFGRALGSQDQNS